MERQWSERATGLYRSKEQEEQRGDERRKKERRGEERRKRKQSRWSKRKRRKARSVN